MKQSILIIAVLGYLFVTTSSVKVRKQQPPSSSTTSTTASASASNSSTNSTNTTDVFSSLLLARTAVDRINILDQGTDFIFDFLHPPISIPPTGKGGNVVLANRATFPALVGYGISMAVGFIGACGLNTPHIHPRATELNFLVNGTMRVGFIAENGARQVTNTVCEGQAAIFPKGSIHWLANLGCESIVFVAGLSDEDPGLSTIAQNFFSIEEDILSATLGGVSADVLNKTASIIPADVALGLETCLQKCGLVQTTSTTTAPSTTTTSSTTATSSTTTNNNNKGQSGHQ
jgi:oxalate decarboxylase/phosphoglucose isomerase-like protein (cupin superfamily)